MTSVDIAIIGGGAAGYFVAANWQRQKSEEKCVLIEAGSKVLSKVRISGGGRCNVTHHEFDIRLFSQYYPRGGRELLGAFSRFQSKDMIEWLAERGVETKAEGDGRMFPMSDDSNTIIGCLKMQATRNGVEVLTGERVTCLRRNSGSFELELSDGLIVSAGKVVIATGGHASGHRLASMLGHTVVEPVPSLFTFKIQDDRLKGLPGLSFPHVEVSLKIGKKSIRQLGPVLITHWGLSGPAVLKLSAWGARALHASNYEGSLFINFASDLNSNEVADLLWQQIVDHPSKQLSSLSIPWFPKRYWQQLLKVLFGEDKKCAETSKKQLRLLVEEVCHASFSFLGKSTNKDEFVTAGGVELREVDFKTMESKIQPGLYIIGEALDVDGITGGFNFQNAWTTGKLCADSLSA